jgi:hypothetical protein
MLKYAAFDTEIFPNRFLIVVKEVESGDTYHLWDDDDAFTYKLMRLMDSKYTFVGFNSYSFDLPIISAALAGAPPDQIKVLANRIIEQEMRPWQVYRNFKLKELDVDHIDLIEVAPGTFSSLKAYGARLNMPWLKDLPFEHDTIIAEDMRDDVLTYCINDVDTTIALFNRLSAEIQLRIEMGAEYGIDMRSKSDTQMAEVSFVKRLNLPRKTNSVPYSLRYKAPSFISFQSEELLSLLQRIQNHEYIMNQKTGHVTLPEFLEKDTIKIGNGEYQLGVGGIHSVHDKRVCHIMSDDYFITDIDAASYYPTILINSNLVPQNTGKAFIDEYKEIYYRRLDAKRTGHKTVAETLKISLNGTFGKTASRWSSLYSPDLMIHITLTGQLVLMSMIEQIEILGARVLSANTDGIAIGATKKQMQSVSRFVEAFSKISQFEFEYTPYRVLAMKDVNNYIAVTLEKKVKCKGLYAPLDIKKNPTSPVCTRAVTEWLSKGVDFMTTIKSSPFTEFLSARSVTGGAVQGDEYLGRVVRWYSSTDKTMPALTYKKNGNRVPKTEGCRACMIIDENVIPSDLDYDWYLKEALEIATNVGAGEYLTEEQRQLIAPPPKVRKTRSKK